ncbi:MAG: DUF131 domain-containing protein [Candidatus Thermoplasmatota archaeon]|nr:DUF131 domain-containing protein [Candidatus Thermoplasmatota archaeon]MDI6855183.1 DUF131 domain-containing protein [Candidatus Thermoplasmatota archaeon]MDI6887248.1 DUF131 domain-containing protein [Candidatus Thermoplasmatota archaeon]
MNYFRLAFIVFVSGIILIALSALISGSISLFLFIPVFYTTGLLGFLGALFIILSLILFVFGFTKGLVYEEEQEITPAGKGEKKLKAGGIVLLGPIPIIFGTDRSLVMILLLLAIILIIAMLALFLMLS